MTAKALSALIQSIAHWERLATGDEKPGESVSADDCALCQTFRNRATLAFVVGNECIGCPVMERTGRSRCRSTPYSAAENHFVHSADKTGKTGKTGRQTPEFRAAAKAELEFLRSLLPADQFVAKHYATAMPAWLPPIELAIVIERDGNQWCAHFSDYTDLRSSPAAWRAARRLKRL